MRPIERKDLIFIKFTILGSGISSWAKTKWKNTSRKEKKEIKTPFCFENESMPRPPLLVHRQGQMN